MSDNSNTQGSDSKKSFKDNMSNAKTATTGFVSRHKGKLGVLLGALVGAGGYVAYSKVQDRRPSAMGM